MSIETLLKLRLQSKELQANSLIITLLGDSILPRGGQIWLGSLIQLLSLFDLNERLVRTTVFRLSKEGWLENLSAGRRANYAISEQSRLHFTKAAEQIYAAQSPIWDQQWRLILTAGDLSAKDKTYLKKILFWQGFGKLGADIFIHPSTNLHTALDGLSSDNMAHIMPSLMPLMAVDACLPMSINNVDLVKKAWDLEKLGSAYQKFIHTYEPFIPTLLQHDWYEPEEAFILRTLLIHDYRRLLLRDPQLPDSLLPEHWSDHQARRLCKDIYLRLLPASEQYLDEHIILADEKHTQSNASFFKRFQPTIIET